MAGDKKGYYEVRLGLAGVLLLALIGCAEAPERNAAANAAEEARISRGMAEVAAGQVRSETNVAEVADAEREEARSKVENRAR